MSVSPLAIVALVALCAWLWLFLGHGGFWRADQRLDEDTPAPTGGWPGVVAVIPARDEAETINEAVRSLLDQDYPGRLEVVVVDDNSTDGTAAAAREAAAGDTARLHIVTGQTLAAGWTGKMWAVHQGIAR
ncbi:MAG: glycosyltransferase, partial [Alphaproteobacteria bacterium]